MNWIQVSIFTTSDGIEPISAKLLDLGISGVEIEDEADFKNFLEQNRDCWDYVDDELIAKKEGETCIKAYIQEDEPELLSAIRASILDLATFDKDKKFGRLHISLSNLKEEDWSNNWKKYFHTLEIGNSLIVKPYWEDVADTDKKVFEINPGLSFGTGSHHTTKLCLLDIQQVIKDGDDVLDLGCGSGILSIVSLMYGAKSALAVDIDPNSMDTAYDNLKRNGFDKSQYEVLIGNILTDTDLQDRILEKKYDVILANIVADVIIASLPFVKKALKDGGTFITSGIIEDRIEDVEEALSDNGFTVLSKNRSADWAEFKCRIN